MIKERTNWSRLQAVKAKPVIRRTHARALLRPNEAMKDDLVDAHLLNHHTLAPAVRPAPKVRVIVGVGQDDIDLDPQAPLRPSEFEVGARASPLHL